MAHHIFFQGGLGASKTLMMSILAHHWKAKVEIQGGKIDLFSNYDLIDSYPMSHYTDWYKVAEAQGSICCWDEAHVAFSNRRWARYGQEVATDVMMYTRKMKSIQLYASPSIYNIDSRIRQIMEVLVTCRRIGDKGFQYHFRDFQTGEFMHSQFIPMYRARRYMKLNLYDTYAMVRGFPLPNNEKQGEEFFEKLNEIHDRARGKRGLIGV